MHPAFTALLAATLALAFGANRQLASGPSPRTLANWYACTSDHDCRITEGVCGSACVSSRFVKEATAYFLSLKPKVECSAPNPNEAKMKAVCRDQRCECVASDSRD